MRITDRRRDRQQCDRWLRRSLATEHALLTVAPVARRNLAPGVTVWAHVPYQERPGLKLRPAVVIDVRGRTVRLRPITGAVSRLEHDRYLEIDDLDEAGLDRACAVNLRYEAEVDLIDIVAVAGRLSTLDDLRMQVAHALLPFVALPSLGIVPAHRPTRVPVAA